MKINENHTDGTGTRQPTQVQSLRWHQTKPNCWTSLRLTKPWAKALLHFLHCCPAWHVPSENRQATEICMKFCPRHATSFCYNSFREISSSSGSSSSPSSCAAWTLPLLVGTDWTAFSSGWNRHHQQAPLMQLITTTILYVSNMLIK